MKYQIIYMDPPWSYQDKAAAGERGSSFKYSTQSAFQIGNMPVASMSDENCVLFLWCTMPKLNEVFDIIAKWGFKYKTVAFVWVKRNKVDMGLFWGMGRWTRANAELCLLATKGKPKRVSASVHSVVLSHIREHSEKPDEVRDRIVELCGDLPRIEFYGRKEVEGWDNWGFSEVYG
jgi:N6-adenosine-specific RNA methylase IME4